MTAARGLRRNGSMYERQLGQRAGSQRHEPVHLLSKPELE